MSASNLSTHFTDLILKTFGESSLSKVEHIQSLWSGYGEIARYKLDGAEQDTIVIKHVSLPEDVAHPRGWNTPLSHQRKVKSYHVETAWYRQYSDKCNTRCYVPKCFTTAESDTEFLIVLEDLDASGFCVRKESISLEEMKVCLAWLANFHATFLSPVNKSMDNTQFFKDLWEIGTYWHLDTRPDELAALTDERLRGAASQIDERLNQAFFQTLVHGDAKLANFCFSADGSRVAAVDFQYVGGGCGMKDVAYFIGSCLYEEDCARYEEPLLASYFASLNKALDERDINVNQEQLEQEWRALFPFAWADFHRFLKGWSPRHWKINDYSEQMTLQVLKQLNG